MSRFRYAARAFVSGYVMLAANLLYTMASVPLALHYLGRQEFGMWALITQIAGYFGLIDFGMTGAVARILADHKDERNGGSYGAILKTGALVFTIQGLLIASLGTAISWILPGIMAIPANIRALFTILMAAQCILLGLTFCAKILGCTLWCHQRSDVINISSAGVFGISFAVLWLGFHFGFGLYSMLLSSAAALFCNAFASWLASSRLRLYPDHGCWGTVSWNAFREVYDYAKNLFLITVGTQLLTASQVVIVTRTLGLDAAAVWSVATKVFTLAQQIVFRICESSLPALVEMFVRREISLIQTRFRHVILLSASVSIVAGATIAVSNGSFLAVWTQGRIAWGPENDVLMAVLLVCYTVIRCHTALMDITKELRVLKYVWLFEGICFVPAAVILSRRMGFAGVIGAAIVLDMVFLGVYSVLRTAKYFQTTAKTVVVDWLTPALRMAVFFLPVAGVIWWLTRGLGPLPRLLFCGSLTGGMGVILLFFVGVTSDMREELFRRVRAVLPKKSEASLL
jgi:O-antigen/teichoic acid export membrane protein